MPSTDLHRPIQARRTRTPATILEPPVDPRLRLGSVPCVSAARLAAAVGAGRGQDGPASSRPSPTRLRERLIRSAVAIHADDPHAILYQHTVLCQTGLPYRDLGAECRQ